MQRYKLHLWVALITLFALLVLVGGMWHYLGGMVFLGAAPVFWPNQSSEGRLSTRRVFSFGMVAGVFFSSAMVGWNEFPSRWFASLDQTYLRITVALAWLMLLISGVTAFRR